VQTAGFDPGRFWRRFASQGHNGLLWVFGCMSMLKGANSYCFPLANTFLAVPALCTVAQSQDYWLWLAITR